MCGWVSRKCKKLKRTTKFLKTSNFFRIDRICRENDINNRFLTRFFCGSYPEVLTYIPPILDRLNGNIRILIGTFGWKPPRGWARVKKCLPLFDLTQNKKRDRNPLAASAKHQFYGKSYWTPKNLLPKSMCQNKIAASFISECCTWSVFQF